MITQLAIPMSDHSIPDSDLVEYRSVDVRWLQLTPLSSSIPPTLMTPLSQRRNEYRRFESRRGMKRYNGGGHDSR